MEERYCMWDFLVSVLTILMNQNPRPIKVCAMRHIIRTFNCMKVLWLKVVCNLKSHHYTTSAARRVLDLTSTLRLPINTNIHRNSNIDPLDTKSIPSWYGLVHTNPLRETSMSIQQCSAWDIPSGLSFACWWLHIKALQRSLNLCLSISAMATSFTTVIYLVCETGNHS